MPIAVLSQLECLSWQLKIHRKICIGPGDLEPCWGPGQVKAACQDGAMVGGEWEWRARLQDMTGPGIEATGHLPRCFFRDG